MQLHRDREKFDTEGVRLAVIGQGTPAHARDFLASRDVEGLELYVDTKRATYKAAGAKMGGTQDLLSPTVALKAARTILRSRVIQAPSYYGGHPAQLGGVMIVKPDGSVPYLHLANDAGDNPPNSEVLAAARAAAPGS
jgi:hypothetical protein